MKFNSVYLMLGEKCNFKCSYCLQREVFTEPIKKHIASGVIDVLNNLVPLKDKILLQFWGGEPLLYFEEIKRIVPLLDRDKFKYSIVSNGALLTEKIVDFLNLHSFNFTVSHDGRNTINTRGIDVLVDKEFLKLFKTVENKAINSVLSANNYKLDEIWDYFDSVFEGEYIYAFHDWIMNMGFLDKSLYEFNFSELDCYLNGFCYNILNKAKTKRLSRYEADFLMHYAQVFDVFMEKCRKPTKTKCGTVTTMLNIDIVGNIYNCHNASGILGNIVDNDYEVIKTNFPNQIKNLCYKCSAFPICQGGCMLIEQKYKDEYYCDMYKILAHNVINLLKDCGEYVWESKN